MPNAAITQCLSPFASLREKGIVSVCFFIIKALWVYGVLFCVVESGVRTGVEHVKWELRARLTGDKAANPTPHVKAVALMQVNISDFADQLRPIAVLYVDVHPFRVSLDGKLEYLLFKRREDVPLPGQWQTISGKIKKEERIADAFVRQVDKKTGCKPSKVYKLAAVTQFYDEYYDTVMMVPGAAAQLDYDSSIALDSKLHTEHRWMKLEETLEMLPWGGQRSALRSIEDTVGGGKESGQCVILPESAFSNN